jgi:glycosyltransferase involved in cell wall biosynthesis
LRILYLDQTAELGGAELSLFAEVTNLPHQARVVLLADGPLRAMFAAAGVPVEVISGGGVLGVRRAAGLFGVLLAVPGVLRLAWAVAARARGCDLIYANSQKALVIGVLAGLLAGRPLVWRLRDVLDAAHFSLSLRRAVVALANRRAARVIVNSAATGRAFVRAGGAAALVALAYPGIDAAAFAETPEAGVAAARAALGPGPLVGLFGRLAAWKGQLVFVEALAALPGVTGVIVGGPLFGEAAFEAALRARIAALGLAGRVRLLGHRADVPGLMRAMDVVVHCSVAPEPFGRVVLEAMLAGRPVVAAAAGGVGEIIEHGLTGFLVPPGNAPALAAALRGVLADAPGRAAVAAAGQARAALRFTVAAMVAQILAALPAGAPPPRCRRRTDD